FPHSGLGSHLTRGKPAGSTTTEHHARPGGFHVLSKMKHWGTAMQSASAIERQTMKKVYLRLLPFCFVLYFICYLDRVNIGFAALTMNKDLELSSYVYGLGAGAFFWGYFLLEVPSNLILEKVGASRWIARIMIGWGIVS